MGGLVPGKPATPSALEGFDINAANIGTLTVDPAAGSSALAIQFNHGYAIYVDNTGTGSANSRWWLDMLDDAQVVIGPRSGTAFIHDLRFRTDATTATAANAFIDSSTYQFRRSTSSRRYKTSIEDTAIDLEKLRRLRVVKFQDRGQYEEMGDDAPWYVGLIAEEVDELGLTEFVSYQTTEDGGRRPDGIQYDRIVVGLLQLLLEQEKRMASFEERLSALEEK